MLFEFVDWIPRLTSPLPVTALVTSSSIHVPATTLPAVARTVLSSAGALLQLMTSSAHPPAVRWTVPPCGEASATCNRSFADDTAPSRPLTLKRT